MSQLAERLGAAIKQRSLTQRAAASEAGVSESLVSKILSGHIEDVRGPTRGKLDRFIQGESPAQSRGEGGHRTAPLVVLVVSTAPFGDRVSEQLLSMANSMKPYNFAFRAGAGVELPGVDAVGVADTGVEPSAVIVLAALSGQRPQAVDSQGETRCEDALLHVAAAKVHGVPVFTMFESARHSDSGAVVPSRVELSLADAARDAGLCGTFSTSDELLEIIADEVIPWLRAVRDESPAHSETAP